ncbi:MAG: YqeG family HAD IIIA-type phosphatase [Bacillota bacterium]
MGHWLVPDAVFGKLTEISPEFFYEKGIKAVLLDLDNTLLPWAEGIFPEESLRWIEEMKAAGLLLCLVSNNKPERVAQLAGELGIPGISQAVKPRRKGFRQALRLLAVKPEETAVVGDQIMTDVLGGNRAGLFTVLVNPLSPVEHKGTYFLRWLERILTGRRV